MNIEREEFSNDKNIPNYITTKFNCNEYFLMGNLLAYSYKFLDKDGFYYQNATDFDKQPSNEVRNAYYNKK